MLTSPAGTKSNILSFRPLDNSSDGVQFTFMTVHHWGEDPAGTWTLEVEDWPKNGTASYSRRRGRVTSWSLVLYGVAGDRPNHHSSEGNSENEVDPGKSAVQNNDDSVEQAREVGTSEVKELMEEEEASSDSVKIESKEESSSKQNTRRRKWLLKKGFEPQDVDFLLALFETEQDQAKRKSSSAGENSPQQKKSEIPDYHRKRHHSGNSEKRNSWQKRTYDAGRRSYWNPSKRSMESVETDKQRIVDQDANDTDITESWRALVDVLSAIVEDD